jgi:hypothetical protein
VDGQFALLNSGLGLFGLAEELGKRQEIGEDAHGRRGLFPGERVDGVGDHADRAEDRQHREEEGCPGHGTGHS